MAGSNAPGSFLVYIKTILYLAGVTSSSTFSGISLEIVFFVVFGKIAPCFSPCFASRFRLKITFAKLI